MHNVVIESPPSMSVIQGFSESWTREEIRAWAFAHPTVPRVIGIDVGLDKLAIWFGAPDPDALATRADRLRFLYFSWVICRCGSATTNKEACARVVQALEAYHDCPFALASDVVIEKQHKKNGRMRAIAATIKTWVRKTVKGGHRMRVVDWQPLGKFANIVQMPCPMPREYAARKAASERVVDAQVREWAGLRWFQFYQRNIECADDAADAALIAQDYAVTVYPMQVIATHALATVHQLLAQRRAQNTWRNKDKVDGVAGKYIRKYTAMFDEDAPSDDDSPTMKRSSSSSASGARNRRRVEVPQEEYANVEDIIPLGAQLARFKS